MVATLRASVRTEKPKAVDRSGLSPADYALLRIDNAFRAAHYVAVDVVAVQRKLARLDALLDDPDLSTQHPDGDPDRIAAVMRHAELSAERERHRDAFRLAAKGVDAAYTHKDLAKRDQGGFVAGAALGWSDSEAFSLALVDPFLGRLPFWIETLTLWQKGNDGEEAPF